MNLNMKLITFCASILLVFVSLRGSAQQEPMYTMNLMNPLAVNPAYAGSNKMLSLQALYRNQWVGFNRSPKTGTFTIHSPIPLDNFGVGLSIINDQLGQVNQNWISLDLSYRLKVNEKDYLSVGLKGSMEIYNNKMQDVVINQDNDPNFMHNIVNETLFNTGFGLYYLNPRYFVGLSVPRLLKNEYETGNQSMAMADLHYYFNAGALIDLNSELKLKPTMQVRYVKDAPVSYEAMMYLIARERLWFGMGYRHNDAIPLSVQVLLSNNLRIAYAYDITTSKLRTHSAGSHEISVSYDMNFNKKGIISPRYF